MTFSRRGAGDSAGRTTWTGKAEIQDYIAFTGFLIYYLRLLSSSLGPPDANAAQDQLIQLLLGGYSYGSLVLGRFPPTQEIVDRFEAAQVGTAAAEIILRARTLAKQSRLTVEERSGPARPRGRTLEPEQSPTSPSKRASPITVGGEETDPSERRRSRDSRRSVDVIRKGVEAPHRIKAHIKRRHSSRDERPTDDHDAAKPSNPPGESYRDHRSPQVSTRYLFISPVLMPFTSNLLPPGAPVSSFGAASRQGASTRQYINCPTLAVFGSQDGFTSGKRLQQWAARQAGESTQFDSAEVNGAGHFWGEAGALQALRERVAEWIDKSAAER